MSNHIIYLFMRGIARFISLLRYNFLSFITLITVIFMYNIFWVAGTGSAGFLNHLASANTVRVYLSSDSKIIAEDIEKTISKVENVESAKYFSPKEAKEFAVANAPKAAGLSSFAEEFFPAFIEIKPVNTEITTLDKIVEDVSIIQGVDEVSYGKEYMTKFRTIGKGAWTFIVIMSLLFALSAIFVIYNTIKLSLYKFKDEIKLYSLVGATRPFISMPYLFGAFFMGFSSFIAGLIIFLCVFSPFNTHILQQSGINIFEIPSISYFFFSCLFVCVISVVSAQASIVSFLKQQVSSINED